MKITYFVKKIVHFDISQKKISACGGHPHWGISFLNGMRVLCLCLHHTCGNSKTTLEQRQILWNNDMSLFQRGLSLFQRLTGCSCSNAFCRCCRVVAVTEQANMTVPERINTFVAVAGFCMMSLLQSNQL